MHKNKIVLLVALVVIFAILGFFIKPRQSNDFQSVDTEINTNTSEKDKDLRPKTFSRLYSNQLNILAEIGADISSIEMVANSEYYAKDKANVYFIFLSQAHVIEGADVESFKSYGSTFAYDKNYVYLDGYRVDGADPLTFTVIKTGQDIINFKYLKDKDSVFFMDSSTRRNNNPATMRIVEGADPQTIRAIGDYDIVADDKKVYFRGKEVEGLDGRTFVRIEPPYFYDKNGYHFFSENMTNNYLYKLISPPGVIKIFTNDIFKGGYVAIGDRVLMGTTTITGADPSTFKVFDADVRSAGKEKEPCNSTHYCLYASDDKSVYYNGKRIIDADAETFELIGYGILKGKGADSVQPQYARDKSGVYHEGVKVEGADPKTFTPLISGGYYFEYGSDAKSVFWKNKLIEGADPETFIIFEGQQPYEGCGAGRYSKDKNNVYYENILIKGADVKTFKIKYGSGAFAEDALNFYKGGEKADPKEFKECNYG